MQRFSALSALGWSATWAVGVAIGVALGAYLTLISSAATPGSVRLDTTELVVLPAMAAGAVFVLSLVVRVLFAVVRRTMGTRAQR